MHMSQNNETAIISKTSGLAGCETRLQVTVGRDRGRMQSRWLHSGRCDFVKHQVSKAGVFSPRLMPAASAADGGGGAVAGSATDRGSDRQATQRDATQNWRALLFPEAPDHGQPSGRLTPYHSPTPAEMRRPHAASTNGSRRL